MTRKTFYKSKRWARARGAALIRDQYRCSRCGTIWGRLEVHHKSAAFTEAGALAEDALDPANLETLCYACHRAAHPETGGARRVRRSIPDALAASRAAWLADIKARLRAQQEV